MTGQAGDRRTPKSVLPPSNLNSPYGPAENLVIFAHRGPQPTAKGKICPDSNSVNISFAEKKKLKKSKSGFSEVLQLGLRPTCFGGSGGGSPSTSKNVSGEGQMWQLFFRIRPLVGISESRIPAPGAPIFCCRGSRFRKAGAVARRERFS